jgi:hypothetical protein
MTKTIYMAPISQLIVKDKGKNTEEVMAMADVSEFYVDLDTPPLFVKGHVNLGKNVAKYFERVKHVGKITEVIPNRI